MQILGSAHEEQQLLVQFLVLLLHELFEGFHFISFHWNKLGHFTFCSSSGSNISSFGSTRLLKLWKMEVLDLWMLLLQLILLFAVFGVMLWMAESIELVFFNEDWFICFFNCEMIIFSLSGCLFRFVEFESLLNCKN